MIASVLLKKYQRRFIHLTSQVPRTLWEVALPLIPSTLITILNGGTRTLNPRDITWLASDNFTSYIAQRYYLSAPWQFPLAANSDYGLENSTSLTYTGPNLFLLIPHKILQLNPSYQFFGVWILVNVYLQVFIGMRIAKRFNKSISIALVFGTLTITPFLVNRMQMHLWLISHFLILWAILIVVKFHQSRQFAYWQTTGLIICSYVINTYLLAMVLIILASWMCYLVLSKEKFRVEISKVLVHTALPLLTCLVFLDGALFRSAPYESARSLLTPTYGAHPANLLTFFQGDTGLPSDLNSSWGDFPQQFSSVRNSIGHIEGDYEGYSYLGLGLLLLIASGILVLIRKNYFKNIIYQYRIYLAAGLGVWLFAITYRVGIGGLELKLPFLLYFNYALSLFRSSGRFMWVIAYALLVIAFIVLTQLLSSRQLKQLLVSVLIIQCADLALPQVERFTYTKQYTATPYFVTTEESKRFAELSRNMEVVRYWPQQNVPTGWGYISLLSVENELMTDGAYTSRPNFIEMRRVESTSKKQLCSNLLQHKTLYVVPKEKVSLLLECGMVLKPELNIREVAIFKSN